VTYKTHSKALDQTNSLPRNPSSNESKEQPTLATLLQLTTRTERQERQNSTNKPKPQLCVFVSEMSNVGDQISNWRVFLSISSPYSLLTAELLVEAKAEPQVERVDPNCGSLQVLEAARLPPLVLEAKAKKVEVLPATGKVEHSMAAKEELSTTFLERIQDQEAHQNQNRQVQS